MKLMLFTVLFLGGFNLFAAVSPQVLKPKMVHHNILRGQGALQGGKAGTGFSLLNVQRTAISKRTERIIIDVGDAQMQKLQGSLGYYNVELKKTKKLVVSFSQTLNSKLESADLQKRFKNSVYVQSSAFQFDPMGQNMTLDLELKKPVVVRVFALKGDRETGKLVIDMIEDVKR